LKRTETIEHFAELIIYGLIADDFYFYFHDFTFHYFFSSGKHNFKIPGYF